LNTRSFPFCATGPLIGLAMYQPGVGFRQTNHPSRIHEHLLWRCQRSVIMLTPEDGEHLQHSLRRCTMASSPLLLAISLAATLWLGQPVSSGRPPTRGPAVIGGDKASAPAPKRYRVLRKIATLPEGWAAMAVSAEPTSHTSERIMKVWR